MRAAIVLLAVIVATSAWHPSDHRIIGGSVTTIEEYPYQAALLYAAVPSFFGQSCGGTILNTRSILTAAHCFWSTRDPIYYRIRVGSTWANSGGTVHSVSQNILHPSYFFPYMLDNDVAIVRLTTTITFNEQTRPGAIAGPSYNVADNQPVWAIGWGHIAEGGPSSEQLRHVQVWIVNQEICRARYAEVYRVVSDTMICSGWLDVGGRDQCQGDSGGPLLHNGVVVGVCSWGEGCADSRYPGVNARVSIFTAWIQANA